MTDKKTIDIQTYARFNDLYGWMAAMGALIAWGLTSFIGHAASLVPAVLCMIDCHNLRQQDKRIPWGWALIPPVYMYKRARALNESLAKFWVCVMIIFVAIAAATTYIAHVHVCMREVASLFDSHDGAMQFCDCIFTNTPVSCIGTPAQ